LQDEVSLDNVIKDLNEYYSKERFSIWIQKVSGGYRIMTRKEYEPWIHRLYQERGKAKLSKSALETLAIIAYNQPVTRVEVDNIRGVNSDYTIRTLLDKKLIEVKGRREGPGRPLLYTTTKYFLEYFGLNSIEDLPSLDEIEEIFGNNGRRNTSE
jgi:segregation and condensation protein B